MRQYDGRICVKKRTREDTVPILQSGNIMHRVGEEGQPPTLDLTTLLTLSFRATSTAVSLAATVLLSCPATGSRILEIA